LYICSVIKKQNKMKEMIKEYTNRVNKLRASLLIMDKSSKSYADTLAYIDSLQESIDAYNFNL